MLCHRQHCMITNGLRITVQIYCFVGLDNNERWFGYSKAKGISLLVARQHFVCIELT